MPKLPALKASPHVIEIERVRRTIPIAMLLKLQEVAVLTGQMPKLDINGQPTGEYDTLRASERLDGLTKLINKAMPDRQEAPMLPEDSSAAKALDVRNLSDEELEALAYAKAADPDAPSLSHGVGSSNSSDPGDTQESSD